jgi:glucosamine--fructose-6-phosphate aminotransferase (isomerizing)
MCGIVGGVSRQPHVVPFLVQGLLALEYRGYDSAGIAVQINPTTIKRVRAVGRVSELEKQINIEALAVGTCGIGHTRWATHGVPAERNAHPHVSNGDEYKVAVVHNGIIENHEPLREVLIERGYKFTSDTDTEVIAHLVHYHLKKSRDLHKAVQLARRELHGLFAIAVMEASNPDVIYATRHGAPLLLGIADDGHYLASDVSALLSKTNKVVYLEDDDMAILRADSWRVESVGGTHLKRNIVLSELDANSISMGEYQHFMQKEIFEQPNALADTLALAGTPSALQGALFGPEAPAAFEAVEEILILACGTSSHAGMVARHWIENIAKIPCTVEIASEFRYREPLVRKNTLAIAISQSGETADTKAALEHAQRLGVKDCLTICNVPESALTRMVNLKFMTRAGPEVGVASTKAFTTQLAALYVLTLSLASVKGHLTTAQLKKKISELRDIPLVVAETLAVVQEPLRRWAHIIAHRSSALFLGRGVLHPIAMEGALKLKEITYIHAEAYSAGELKHGPLALIDEHMPVIINVANDCMTDKVKANIEEVMARKGEVFIIADIGCEIVSKAGQHLLELPMATTPELSPIPHVIVHQLLSYFTALERGTDIDKPRNLAKSVTVE